ncbi:OLC1v1001216C2 [Oldenlandia corymbosa var. corymbosa]|nr:OLC1v1001216C2 [Oldenlandia corymbosa var. corymbosa]
MHKQELISAAEASGLSRVSIAPELGKGKPGRFGTSPNSWYSGWSCMKTLITKGLVVKSSCPAKYMLTEEGKVSARECLSRSQLAGQPDDSSPELIVSGLEPRVLDTMASTSSSKGFNDQKKPIDIPPESLNKFIQMGFSRDQIVSAFVEASERFKTQDMSSLWPAVLCQLKADQIYGGDSVSNLRGNTKTTHGACRGSKSSILGDAVMIPSESSDEGMISMMQNEVFDAANSLNVADSDLSTRHLGRCSLKNGESLQSKSIALATPPLEFGETFEDAYGVILILDDREHFANPRSNLQKIIQNISSQFKIPIEVRRLPVGDAIWVARHKSKGAEYVLDFVVERKRVDDLRSSIRDNRYKDQKLRLLSCGLKKLIYIVEGDPNFSEAAESIKTACFTTEILEGFDVQRTSGLGDTLKKYGYLTKAIYQYYKSLDFEHQSSRVCPPYSAFIRRCEDLDKMTISNLFAIQLMQVPQVTEEIAVAVLEIYPTLISLARAYALLDDDIGAQEELLKKQSDNVINGAASRNIFQLIWGNRGCRN